MDNRWKEGKDPEMDRVLKELRSKKLILDGYRGPNKRKRDFLDGKIALHNLDLLWDHENDKPSPLLEKLREYKKFHSHTKK